MVNSFCQKSDCLIDNLAIAFLTQVTATSHSHHKANWCNLAIALSCPLSPEAQSRGRSSLYFSLGHLYAEFPPFLHLLSTCWALSEHLLSTCLSCFAVAGWWKWPPRLVRQVFNTRTTASSCKHLAALLKSGKRLSEPSVPWFNNQIYYY